MAQRHAPWEGPPKIITVWSGKGGIGKSTIASLLAWLLGHLGRTLLVDADARQEDASSSELYAQLKVDPTYDVATEEDPSLLGKLRQVRGYRFIVIDNGPYRDPELLKATCDGDLVIVPMVPEHLEIKGTMSSLRKFVIPSGKPFRVVMNRVTTARKSKAATTHSALQTVGIPVFRVHVREYVAHSTAGAIGTPITYELAQNWDKAATDARDLADEVLDALGETDRVPREKEVAA